MSTMIPTFDSDQTLPEARPQIRFYLVYRSLHLADLRALLVDLEGVYNMLDRERARYSWMGRVPLRVEQMQTGNSISMLFVGDPIVMSVISQILTSISSREFLSVGGSLSGLIYGALKMRKALYEGSKAKEETIKLKRENQMGVTYSAIDNGDSQEAQVSRASPDPETIAAERLYRRLARIKSSSRMERLEIDVDGKRFLLDREERQLIIESFE